MSNVVPAVIIHPSTLFRDGLRQILAGTRFRPIHIAPGLDEATIRSVPASKACLWLIGIDERCSASIYEFVGQLCATTPAAKAVILLKFQAVEEVLLALNAGASGVLSPDISSERLVKSLELVALGETVVPADFLHNVRRLMTKPLEPQPPPQTEQHKTVVPCPELRQMANPKESPGNGQCTTAAFKILSRREMTIMRLLINGAPNKVIARQLVITEATVKVHIKAILRKLRLQNRTQAAMWAYNNLSTDGVKHNGAEVDAARENDGYIVHQDSPLLVSATSDGRAGR